MNSKFFRLTTIIFLFCVVVFHSPQVVRSQTINVFRASGGGGRLWYRNYKQFRHTVNLEPSTTTLELGTHFRVRLATTYPGGLNVSFGRVQLRLISAYDAKGAPIWCNNSKAVELAVSEDLFPSATNMYRVGRDNVKAVVEAAAIFVAPSKAFRVCWKNKNFTNTWQTPSNEAAHYGTVRNVTRPRIRFEINNDDYTAGSYAAIKITSTTYKLVVNSDEKLTDQLKFVTCGTPCVKHEENARYPGLGTEAGDTAGQLTGRTIASTTQNILPGGYLVNTQFTSSSSVSALANGEYLEYYARIRLPPVGCYQLCFSSFNERAKTNSTVWRYLYKKNSYTVNSITTLSPIRFGVNWTLPDRRAFTWGSMKISETVASLVRSTPASTAYPNAVSVGGNQIRIIPVSKFTSTTNAPSTGCFDSTNIGGTDHVGINGPTESTDLGADWMAKGKPWTSDLSPIGTAYAYIRLPAPGRYHVCWQAAGFNWIVLPMTYSGTDVTELVTTETLNTNMHDNVTWWLNDTAALTWAPLYINARRAILRNTPNYPWSPATDAVAIRVVTMKSNCWIDAAEDKTEVFDTGVEETPWGRLAQKGSADDDPMPRKSVVAYIQIPTRSSSGYRVCFKRGANNWEQLEPSLMPTASYPIKITLADTRADTWGRFLISSGPGFNFDIRPVKALQQWDGSFKHIQGDQLKLIRNGTNCDRTDDPDAMGFGDAYSNVDLGLYCVVSANEGSPCSGKANGFTDSSVDANRVKNAVAYIKLPKPGSYRVCYKRYTKNWKEVTSVRVAPAPLITMTLSGDAPADGTYSAAVQNVDFTLTRSTAKALNTTNGGDAVKMVPVEQECDRDPYQRTSVTDLMSPVAGVSNNLGSTLAARARFVFPIESQRRMLYAVCYKFQSFVNWYRFPSPVPLTASGIEYAVDSIPMEDGIITVTFRSQALFNTNDGKDMAKIIIAATNRWCQDSEPAVGTLGTNLGPSDLESTSVSSLTVTLPHAGSQQLYRVCYKRYGFPWMEINETTSFTGSDMKLANTGVSGAAANRFITRTSPLSTWTYASSSRTELTVPGTSSSPPQYVAGAATNVYDTTALGDRLVLTIRGTGLQPAQDEFKLVKSQEKRGQSWTVLGSNCQTDVAEDGTSAWYPRYTWSLTGTTSAVQPYITLPVDSARYVGCFRTQGRWLQVPSLEIETTSPQYYYAVTTSNGNLIFTIYDQYLNSSRLGEPTMVPGASGDVFQMVNDSAHCGQGTTTYTLSASSGTSCTVNCSSLVTAEMTPPALEGNYRICYKKGATGPTARSGVWMTIPSTSGSKYYVNGVGSKLALLTKPQYNTTTAMRLGDIVTVTIELRTNKAGVRVFTSGAIVTAAVTTALGSTPVEFLNTQGLCLPGNTTQYGWPSNNGMQVLIDGRVTFNIQILDSCGPNRVCRITFTSPNLASVSIDVLTKATKLAGLQTIPSSRFSVVYNPTTPVYTGKSNYSPLQVIALDVTKARVWDATTTLVVQPDTRDLGTTGNSRCLLSNGIDFCSASGLTSNTFEVPMTRYGLATFSLSFYGTLSAHDEGRSTVRVKIYVKSSPDITITVLLAVNPTVASRLVITDVIPQNATMNKWEPSVDLPQQFPIAADGYYFMASMPYRVVLEFRDDFGRIPDIEAVQDFALLVSIVGGGGDGKGGVLVRPDGGQLPKPTPTSGKYAIDLMFTQGCGRFIPAQSIREYCQIRFDAGQAFGLLTTGVRVVGTQLLLEGSLQSRPGVSWVWDVTTTDAKGYRDYYGFGIISPELVRPTPYQKGLIRLTNSRGDNNLTVRLENGKALIRDMFLTYPCPAEGDPCRLSLTCSWGCGFYVTAPVNVTQDQDHLTGNVPTTLGLLAGEWISINVKAVTENNEDNYFDTTWIWVSLTKGTLNSFTFQSPRFVVENGRSQPLINGKRSFRVKFLDPCTYCILTFEAKARAGGWTDPIRGIGKRTWSTQAFEVSASPVPNQIAFHSISPWMTPIANQTLWFEGEYNQVFNLTVKITDIYGYLTNDSRIIEITASPAVQLPGFISNDMGWTGTGVTGQVTNGMASFALSANMPCVKCVITVSNNLDDQTRRVFSLFVYVTFKPNGTAVATVDPTNTRLVQTNVDIFPSVLRPYSLNEYNDEWTGPVYVWVVEEVLGLRFIDYTQTYTIEITNTQAAQTFACHSSVNNCTKGTANAKLEFTINGLTAPQVIANPLLARGMVNLVGSAASVSGKFLVRVEEKNRNGLIIPTWQQNSATTWLTTFTPNKMVILNVSTGLGIGDYLTLDGNGYATTSKPHPDFDYTIPSTLFANVPFPITIQIHNDNGTLSRPITDKQGEGSVKVTAEYIGGCGVGAPAITSPSVAFLVKGNTTVWVTFATPCQRCRLRVEFSTTSSTQLGLPRAEMIKYTDPITVGTLTANAIIVTTPRESVPSSIRVGDTITVKFRTVSLVQNKVLPFSGTFAADFGVTIKNAVVYFPRTYGNGGFITDTVTTISKRTGVKVTFTDGVATASFSFPRSCQRCKVLIVSPFEGQAPFFLRNDGVISSVSNDVFQVRTTFTRHTLVGNVPTQVSRKTPFALTLWAVDDNNDLDLQPKGDISFSRAPRGGNGDGGILTHTNGFMSDLETVWVEGSQTWRFEWSEACLLCTMTLGQAPAIQMQVVTAAVYLFVEVTESVLRVGQPFSLLLTARDESDNIDYTIGARLASGEKANVAVSITLAPNRDGTGVFDQYVGNGGSLTSADGSSLFVENGVLGGGNGSMLVKVPRPVAGAYFFAVVQTQGRTITSALNNFSSRVDVVSPAFRILVLNPLTEVYTGNFFTVRVGAVDSSPTIATEPLYKGPFVVRSFDSFITVSTSSDCPSKIEINDNLFRRATHLGETNFTIALTGGTSCGVVFSTTSGGLVSSTYTMNVAVKSVPPEQLRFVTSVQPTAWVLNRTFTFQLQGTDSAGRIAKNAKNDVTLTVTTPTPTSGIPCMVPFNNDGWVKNLLEGATSFQVTFTSIGVCGFNLVSTGLDVVSKLPFLIQVPTRVRFVLNSTAQYGPVLFTGEVYAFTVELVDRLNNIVTGDTGSTATQLTISCSDPTIPLTNTNLTALAVDGLGRTISVNDVLAVNGRYVFQITFPVSSQERFVGLVVQAQNNEQGRLGSDFSQLFVIRTKATRVILDPTPPRYYINRLPFTTVVKAVDSAVVPNVAYTPLPGYNTPFEIRYFSSTNDGWLSRIGLDTRTSLPLDNGTMPLGLRWIGPDGTYRLQLRSSILPGSPLLVIQFQTIAAIRFAPSMATFNWTRIRATEEFIVDLIVVDAQGDVVLGDYTSNVTGRFTALNGTAKFDPPTGTVSAGAIRVYVTFTVTTNNASIGFFLKTALDPLTTPTPTNFSMTSIYFSVDIATPRTPSPDDSYIPPYLALQMTAFGTNPATFDQTKFINIISSTSGVKTAEVSLIWICRPNLKGGLPSNKTIACIAGPGGVTAAPSHHHNHYNTLEDYGSGIVVQFQILINRTELGRFDSYVQKTANAITQLKLAIQSGLSDQTTPFAKSLGLVKALEIQDGNALPPPPTTPSPPRPTTPAPTKEESDSLIDGGNGAVSVSLVSVMATFLACLLLAIF
eukprot:PhF_6_TR38589/c1_g1_i1/m.57369